MSRGVMVETLETSTTWSNLMTLYRAVDQVISMQAVVVGCHISHLYQTGASLYFTFLTPQTTSDAAGQWRQLKSAACQTIVDNGGAITHHHAIGVDHKPYLKAEDGATGIAALRAVKRELDPSGVMNPGKLL
jgi:alkyldihydroxyacetonephosphate synthase